LPLYAFDLTLRKKTWSIFDYAEASRRRRLIVRIARGGASCSGVTQGLMNRLRHAANIRCARDLQWTKWQCERSGAAWRRPLADGKRDERVHDDSRGYDDSELDAARHSAVEDDEDDAGQQTQHEEKNQ
jgi:hypothetical protein